jgi:hypothetical protein
MKFNQNTKKFFALLVFLKMTFLIDNFRLEWDVKNSDFSLAVKLIYETLNYLMCLMACNVLVICWQNLFHVHKY